MYRTFQDEGRFFSEGNAAIYQVFILFGLKVSAHGAVGERPRGDGRSPMGRWARAHGPMGADFLREKNVQSLAGCENLGMEHKKIYR